MRIAILSVLVGLALAACTSTPPTPFHSCMLPPTSTYSFCVDFIAGGTGDADERAFCDRSMGTYSTTRSCPSTGWVGRCTEMYDGTSMGTDRSSYYPPSTTDDVRSVCPPPSPAPGSTYELETP